MAQEHKPASALAVTWMAASLGLLTFIAGIVMLILVFTWAHDTLTGIDAALGKVKTAKAVQAPAPPSSSTPAPAGPQAGKSAPKPAPEPAPSVAAAPGGPSLATVAVGLLLKLVGLLVLGILAGIVAARGAHMVAGALRPPAMVP